MAGTLNHLGTVNVGDIGDNPRIVPGYVSARLLAASVAESITVPPTAAYVRLVATADIYYSFSGAATVPGDVDDGTACELVKAQGDPEWLIIPTGATALSVISAGTPVVTASFYVP